MQIFYKIPFKNLVLIGLGTISFVIISILFLDQRAAHLLSPEQAAKSYRITRTLTDVGESAHFFLIAILGSLVSWMTLKYKKNIRSDIQQKLESLRKWSLNFLISLILCGIATHLIKFLVGRARPNRSESHFPWEFDFFNSHWHNHSFPSGHSQTLFTAAVAFAFAFPKFSKAIFGLAAIFAITRVLLNQHFLSDVMMGAYIGYAGTILVFNHRSQSE